jgi:SAM-dependent methyltransferase
VSDKWLKTWFTPEYQELKDQDVDFVLEYFKNNPPSKILDIGCGLAWESRAMQQHFGSELWLLDGDQPTDTRGKKEIGWRGDAENMSFYHSLVELDELLQQLGTENYHLVDANNIQIDEDVKFDLVYSAISCGFHYNANTYMDLIRKY